jgi:hypothetical protein
MLFIKIQEVTMKKIALSFLVFVMALTSTIFSPALTSATVNANTQTQTTAGCNCSLSDKKISKEEALQNLVNEGVAVKESLSQQDIAKVEKALKKHDALNNSFKDVEKKGFKKVKESENYVTMENLPLGNKMFESVTFAAGFFQSKESESPLIVNEAIVDNTTQEVVKYQLLEVTDSQYKILDSFQKQIDHLPSIDWGGVHCDWVSLVVCGRYCSFW